MKTRAEVENLKKLWLDDTEAFDLTKVEGYEDYQEELKQFVEQHENPLSKLDFGGPITKLLMDSLFNLFGGGESKSPEEIIEDIAQPILKKMIREAPEEMPEQLVQDYYEQIGFDAYQRAHYVIMGRNKFAKFHCPCATCTSQRERTARKAKE